MGAAPSAWVPLETLETEETEADNDEEEEPRLV